MPTLNWIGKDKVITHHHDVPFRVLEHQYGFTADAKTGKTREDKTETHSGNKIIHGDNLEALKSLLPEYEGKIKCIYIDPPYNTGNENWVYNDNVNHPKIKKWLGEVVGKEGDDLSRHDKWLCMMYPRLQLLHKLLANDGAIFISIGVDEFASLKMLCDEIFGRNNFRECFIWYNEGNTENQEEITSVHEYILMYAKRINKLKLQNVVDPNIPKDSKIRRNFVENSLIKNGYKNPPVEIELPAGFPCEVESLLVPKTENYKDLIEEVGSLGYFTREMKKKYGLSYPIRQTDMVVEDYKLQSPIKVYSGWSASNKLKRFIKNECKPYNEGEAKIRFYLTKNGVIYYRKEGRESHFIPSVLRNMGTTETNKYLLESMGLEFNFPKPIELITFLISSMTTDNDIVLDSFAGSGTTAHAVLKLNESDGENRRFILIEMEDYARDKTAKRIQNVLTGYSYKGEKHTALTESFDFYTLGCSLFKANDNLNEEVATEKIRAYVWFSETRASKPVEQSSKEPYLLGVQNDTAYYFIYEKESLTTLDYEALKDIKTKAEQYVIYADNCLLPKSFMNKHNIIFKKIPRDITRF